MVGYFLQLVTQDIALCFFLYVWFCPKLSQSPDWCREINDAPILTNKRLKYQFVGVLLAKFF